MCDCVCHFVEAEAEAGHYRAIQVKCTGMVLMADGEVTGEVLTPVSSLATGLCLRENHSVGPVVEPFASRTWTAESTDTSETFSTFLASHFAYIGSFG